MNAPNRTVTCGAFLREIRLRHGLSQTELARRLGTDQPAISRIERDAVSPGLDSLNRILEAMGDTLALSTAPLDRPPAGAGNRSIAELRADYRGLTSEQRIARAAELSRVATELAAQGPG